MIPNIMPEKPAAITLFNNTIEITPRLTAFLIVPASVFTTAR